MLNQTLEELALNILIEGEFDTLPIKITHLAKVNRVDYLNNFEHENLKIVRIYASSFYKAKIWIPTANRHKKLAALVMAPKCVLKACKVSSAENLHVLTAVPIKIATDLYEHLNTSSASEALSEKEKQVVAQFHSFINQQLSENRISQTIKKKRNDVQSRSSFFYLIPSKMTVLLFFAALFPFGKKYIRNSLVDITHTVGIISGIV